MPGFVVQSVASPIIIADSGVMSLIPPGPIEIDHEIFSKIILLLPLVQEGLLLVTSESMCTISTGKRLSLSLPTKKLW